MPVATYKVYVDWDADDNFSGPYDDITADVTKTTIKFGRNYASDLVGRSIAGSLAVQLNNPNGKYSRFEAASPLYGNLLPKRKTKVTMDDGDEVTIWSGDLDAIRPNPTLKGLKTATLYGIGPLGVISQRKTNVAMQTDIFTGAAVDVLLDRVGWPAGDRDISVGTIEMARWWTGSELKVLTALRDLEVTEGGFLRETRDGKIAFDSISTRFNAVSVASFSDAPGSALVYKKIIQDDALKHIYNIVKARIRSFTVEGLATLWTLNDTPLIQPADELIFWAQYPNEMSAINAMAVDAWTTPETVTDFTANVQADGGGADMTADISVAVVKFDSAIKITLTNNGANTGYITLLQARGTALTENESIPIEDQDAASISLYGEREFPLEAKFLPDWSTALVRVQWYKDRYSVARPILKMTFDANRNAALLALAQSIDLNQVLTIEANSSATELGIDTEFHVESIRHVISKSGSSHDVTVELSQKWLWVFTEYWQLGVSKLGYDTRLGV